MIKLLRSISRFFLFYLVLGLLLGLCSSNLTARSFNHFICPQDESNLIFTSEICDNGIDDDGDGYADCFDEDCPCYAPFLCDGTALYQTIKLSAAVAGQGEKNEYILYRIDPSTVTFHFVANLSTSGNVSKLNSIGYNPKDNFLYGIQNGNPFNLYRINALGEVKVIGQISGLSNGSQAGDIAADGTYYITGGSKKLYAVDLNTLQATLVGSTGYNMSDIAFNPDDGYLYGWAQGGNAKHLVKIDPATANVTKIGQGDTDFSTFGATYFNASGALIAYGNDTRNPLSQETLVKIDIDSGTVSVLGTGLSTGGNDGCACPYGMALELSATDSIVAGDTFSYTIDITNKTGLNILNAEAELPLRDGLLWASNPYNTSAGLSISANIKQDSLGTFTISNIPPGNSQFNIDAYSPQDYRGANPYPAKLIIRNIAASISYMPDTIYSDDPDTDAILDSTKTQIHIPEITVSLESKTEACPNSVVPFHLSLINQSGATAKNFEALSIIPSGFSYYGDTISASLGAVYDSTKLPAFGDADTLRWGQISLEHGDTLIISFSLLASKSLSNGQYQSQFSLNGVLGNLSGISNSTTIGGVHCTTPVPFVCESAFYQTYRKKNSTANKFARLNPADGSYTEIAVIDAMVNGMGFDAETGIAYGSSHGRLVSLTSDGTITDLGLKLPKHSYCGDMDDKGYWYARVGTDMIKVDPSIPAILETYAGQGFVGWDMAYNLDGNFYSVHKNILYKFNTQTQTKSTVGTITGAAIPLKGHGAQWTGSDSMLYISNNATGDIFRIDVYSLEARLVMQSTSGLKLNDGFACPTELPVIYEYDYGDLSGANQARNLVFVQDTNQDDIPDYECVWLGNKVAIKNTDPANATATGDPNDDGIILPSSFEAGNKAQCQIRLNTNMHQKKVCYGFWADWDNDQQFEDFYQGSAIISGDTTIVQKVNCPGNYKGGRINFRCRVREEEMLSQNMAGGDLGLGETEDFSVSPIEVNIVSQSKSGPNGVVSYHATLINNSGTDVVGMTLSDTLPSGFSYYGDTLELLANTRFDSTIQPVFGQTGTISWGGIDIPNGDTLMLSYSCLVSAAQANGTYTNRLGCQGAIFSPNSTTQSQVSINSQLTSNPNPFDCEPAFYQVYKKRNEANTFARLDVETGDYVQISVLDANANGLGYHPGDNLAYGASGKRFIRLDEAGIMTDMGIGFSKKCFVGDIDQQGYWYGRVGADMIKIDLSGPTIAGTYSGEGMPGWDMAYNLDGNFYAVHGTTLYQFDPQLNTKSTLGAIGGESLPGGGYGAQWTGSDSMLYISHNQTGNIFRIDIENREARLVMTSTAGLKYNDGFSCPLDLPAVFEYEYGDFQGAGTARNLVYAKEANGNGIPDYDAVWLGTAVSADTSNPANGDASGDSYDDGLQAPDEYLNGESATLMLTLNSNQSNKSVYYGLWIDWQGDGSFEDFYQGNETISAASTIEQQINVPLSYTGGPILYRLRCAESVLAESDSIGDLGIGETEDHYIHGKLQELNFVEAIGSGLETQTQNTWGAAWGDYDGDGDEDLIVSAYDNHSSSRVYQNNGDGTFTSVAVDPITSDQGSNVGLVLGDYDNDGNLDLFAANNVRALNHLYHNEGGGTFSRTDGGEISEYGGYCHSASFVDYDGDGLLDVFVTDFMPTRFNRLYHNDGNGNFSLAPSAPMNLEAKATLGAAWADYDNDGLVDLFVPNCWGENNSLYHNEGNGQFSKITSSSIVSDGGNSIGASWGDCDNDGDLDLYVTNASNQPNFYYINQGNGNFVRNTADIIATDQGHSFGSSWGDFDLDGDLDLYVANDNGSRNCFYRNDGSGNFTKDNRFTLGSDQDNSMSVTTCDYDQDGDLDIYVANSQHTKNRLYKNDYRKRGKNRYCGVKLSGRNCNRSAIGTKIRVKANIGGQDRWQMREVCSQSGGVSAQSSMTQLFGMGDATTIDSLVVEWSSGYTQVQTNIPTNTNLQITEDAGKKIIGKAFVDANQNCQLDANEVALANIQVQIDELGNILTTDAKGQFTTYLQDGNYTFTQQANANYSHPCFVNRQITISNGNLSGNLASGDSIIYFPNQAACGDPDMGVSLSSTVLRRGFQNSYAIQYRNQGAAAAANVQLSIQFDPDIIPLSATIPWTSHSGSTYTWDLGTVNAFEDVSFMLVDSVSAEATLGKMTQTTASFNAFGADCELSNNSFINYNEVVGAIDPNDILVSPEGAIAPDDTLTYRIRFQNVGNSPAQKVVIVDTLSEFHDPETMQILGGSHPFTYDLSDEQVLTITFDYIMLPDSLSNEPESHGYIEYQIQPKKDTRSGALIQNRAAIQFDFNAFILTNQVENQILTQKEAVDESSERVDHMFVIAFPNPAYRDINVRYSAEKGQDYQLEIINGLGAQMYQQRIHSDDQSKTIQLSVEEWPAGYYYLKFYSNDKSSTFKFIVQ